MLSGSSPYTVCTWEELFPLKFEKLAVEKIILSGYLRRAPSFSLPYISAFPKLPNLKELTMYTGMLNHTSETNLDPLWILLKNSGAELSRLALRYGLSDTLVDYLASYSGLPHLDCKAYHPPVSISDSFLSRVLPYHAGFLTSMCLYLTQNIDVDDSSREGVAINPSTGPASSAFRSLTTLNIPTPPQWDLTPERYRHLLDYITGIPKLRQFVVQWLRPSASAHSGQPYAIDADEFGRCISSISENVFVRRCSLAWLEIKMQFGTHLRASKAEDWRIKLPGMTTTVNDTYFPDLMGITTGNVGARLRLWKSNFD